ncbi:MAG TPA: AAA family ATPase [Rhizomicrobium sp.]|nr:AAA family ATPase [Rhizomicrobium sp.]
MRHYLISGLRVCSEIVLPGAIPQNAESECDVVVRRGFIAPEILGTNSSRTYHVAESVFFYEVPDLARFRVSHGREILVDVVDEPKESEAALFVLTVFGALLYQRNYLALHGSAVAINGNAVIFCGPSGAGKSTLAASLVNEGYEFLSDDLCRVDFDSGGRPVLFPDGRTLKLWEDSLDHLQLAHSKGAALRSNLAKFFVSPGRLNAMVTLPLGAVYILGDSTSAIGMNITDADSIRSLALLRQNAYHPELLAQMGLEANFFQNALRMLRYLKVFSIDRPRAFSEIRQDVGILEAHWVEIGLT